MKKTLVALLLICIIGANLASCGSNTPTETPESLISQGRYSEAYSIADMSQKKSIWAENVVAVLSEKTSDFLKNPDSFVLHKAYHYGWINSETNEFGQQVAIYSTGENSFGAAVGTYHVWMFNVKKSEWEYFGSTDTTEVSKSDSTADIMVKVLLKDILTKGDMLDKSQINNINRQFENDTLYTVDLIPISSVEKSVYEK